jgi:hypothetical protein
LEDTPVDIGAATAPVAQIARAECAMLSSPRIGRRPANRGVALNDER